MRWLVLVAVMAGCGDDVDAPFGFHKHVLDTAFRAEGVTVFDVNRDGHLDIVTEELWHAGPTFTRAIELRPAREWDQLTQHAHCFHAFHADIDTDGYEDLIVFGLPTSDIGWCRNPEGQEVHWECFPIAAQSAGESPLMADVFGTGPTLITGIGPERVIAAVTPATLGAPWTVQALSPNDFLPVAQHGLGAVDINSDGRLDLVTGAGWLEHPADAASPWPWHPTDICVNNCAHMLGYDVNGDGRTDLLGTSPHAYGAWWFEQVGSLTEPTFVPHLIDDTVSQMHAAQLADLDRDGIPELVSGKRWYAHFTGDPGIDDPVVLVMYKLTRDAGAVTWTRTDIDQDSGVGNEFDVVDMNRDGKLDIVIASRKGLFYFEQN